MSNTNPQMHETDAIIRTKKIPSHLTAEALAREAEMYCASYKCDIEKAIDDVIDAYREGEDAEREEYQSFLQNCDEA